jgi:aspartate/tyrosine/aromatic aminotransferase
MERTNFPLLYIVLFVASRIGCTFLVASSAEYVNTLRSQLKAIIRPMWSNPPVEGARIVTTVLSNPALLAEW